MTRSLHRLPCTPFLFLAFFLLACQKPNAERTPSPPAVTSPDASTDNALVYVASDNGNLYAVDAVNGSTKWTFAMNKTSSYYRSFSSPALVDSTLYVGSGDGHLYAVDAITGKEKWRFLTSSQSGLFTSSPVVADGVVYVAGYSEDLYAIDARTGRQRWKRTFAGLRYFEASPAHAGGMLYLGVGDGKLYALDAATGATRWTYSYAYYNFSNSSPVVKDGVVYALGEGTYSQATSYTPAIFLAINALTGAPLPTNLPAMFPFGFTYLSSPTVPDSLAFVAGTDSCVYALRTVYAYPYTTVKWKYKADAPMPYSSPAVDTGSVYVGSENGTLYAINRQTGSLRWKFSSKSYGSTRILSSPVSVNGLVFVGGTNGLFALDAETGTVKWQGVAGAYFESSPCVLTKKGVAHHASISGMAD